MYPTAVIEAAIERAAAEFPDDAPNADHFLALANYALEKADEFSGHLLMVSGLVCSVTRSKSKEFPLR